MTEKNRDASRWPSLVHGDGVYRAVLGRNHYQKATGKILSGAFKRRAADITGLSVIPQRNNSLNSIKGRFKDVPAIGSLVVGEIRAIETEPVLDVIQNKQDHANIMNLPAHDEDDFKAENLASELVKICVRVHPE